MGVRNLSFSGLLLMLDCRVLNYDKFWSKPCNFNISKRFFTDFWTLNCKKTKNDKVV